MGRGKRRLATRAETQLPLSDGSRGRPVPAQLATALGGELEQIEALDRGRWLVYPTLARVYRKGENSYCGTVAATTGWHARMEPRERPRGKAKLPIVRLDGDDAVLYSTDTTPFNVLARVYISDSHGHVAAIFDPEGELIGQVLIRDSKVEASVFQEEKFIGTVKSKGLRGNRPRLDLRLAGAGAYFFLLER
jgi:hypothetical protein